MKSRLTISDLVTAAKCERQAALDARYGKRRSKAWEEKARVGAREHAAYQLSTALGGSVGDRRCFVATVVYGPDAFETNALRKWRDERLMSTAAGRLFIAFYYAMSPEIVAWIEGRPRALRIVRVVLNRFVAFVENRK